MILCISVFSVVISPFSFLILLIWFFSLVSWWVWLMVCQFYLSFQRTSFRLCWFLLWSLLFLLHLFLPYIYIYFKISFLLLTLGFSISSFSSCFRCRVRLFIWLFSCFLRCACIAMNFPLRTAFTVSHRFWVVVFSFSLVSMHILISFLISSVICWLFRSVLFNLHMLEFLIVFLL